jgi:hypothetical protein
MGKALFGWGIWTLDKIWNRNQRKMRELFTVDRGVLLQKVKDTLTSYVF